MSLTTDPAAPDEDDTLEGSDQEVSSDAQAPAGAKAAIAAQNDN